MLNSYSNAFLDCNGTSTKLKVNGDPETRYADYKRMYTNCTRVNTNLEIVFLTETVAEHDLTFLQSILEVRGYVLVYGNHIRKIPLTGLRVIRGLQVFSSPDEEGLRGCSLCVANNYHPNDSSIGLEELQLKSLKGPILRV